MKKQEKTFFVQNLAEELKNASSIVLVDYAGLTVKAQQELKKQLKKVNAQMSVVKNTLFKRAGKSAKIDEQALNDTVLAGPTALVLSQDDPIAPLQTLAKFAKDNELPQLKVGIIEGGFQDTDSLSRLSKLPGRDILVGQAIGTIASQLYGLTATLLGNLQKLVFILSEYESKRVEEPK